MKFGEKQKKTKNAEAAKPKISNGNKTQRIIYGGSWRSLDIDCRLLVRNQAAFESFNDAIGFRIAASAVH